MGPPWPATTSSNTATPGAGVTGRPQLSLTSISIATGCPGGTTAPGGGDTIWKESRETVHTPEATRAKVTGTRTSIPPGAVTRIAPVCDPAASPAILGWTEIWADPDGGSTAW